MEVHQKKVKGTAFHVELEGIELPEKLREEINDKIQNIVMESLGRLDLRQKSATAEKVILMPNSLAFFKDWYGLLIRRLGKDLLPKIIEQERIDFVVIEQGLKSRF